MSVEPQPLPLQVFALGTPNFLRDQVSITHQLSRTAQLLLIYLLTTNGEHPRESLAELFWPERESRLAGSNLRTVLSDLRRHCAEFLTITRDYVAIKADQIRYDVTDFRAQINAAKAAIAQNDLTTAVTHWEAVLRLHQAPFLVTLREPESSELQLWLAFERELLYKQMLGALRQLVAYYTEGEESERALPLVQRWLALEPLDEEAIHQLMNLYARRDEPETALSHYQRFRQLYRQEQGLWPSNPTLDALASTITEAVGRPLPSLRAGSTATPTALAPDHPWSATPAPRFAPPALLVNLYGREEQIDRLCDLLRSTTTRLISLVGMGGAGKSLLAQAVGLRLAETLAAGVCFVKLADVRTDLNGVGQQQQIALTIATALGCKVSDETMVIDTVQRYLRDLELLLILDNCEEVAGALGWINDLLRAAPRLRILTTTRVRLNLLAETVELVHSLPLPADIALATLQSNPCIQLFAERAQRVFPGFALDATNAPALQQICRAVGGLPLALELAAHWTPLFTPAEIAATLAQELDLLTTAYRDVPERQRRITTVLAQSWQLLPPAAQRALAALTIFQNSFTRTAAVAVAACTLPTLVTLVNHALLEVRDAGVYGVHPLVKSFAATHRQADDGVESRYRAYLLTEALPAIGTEASDAPAQAWVDLLTRQRADLVQAWEWAVACGDDAQLAQALPHFCYFWRIIGQPREALRLLTLLQQRLVAQPAATLAQQALLARTLYQKMSIAHHLLGDLATAAKEGEEAHRLLVTVGTPVEVGHTLLQLGQIYVRLERAHVAIVTLQNALTIAQEERDLRLQIGVATVVARIYWAQGHWEDAAAECRSAALLIDDLPEPPVEAFALWWEIFNQALLRRNLAVAEATLQRMMAWGERRLLTNDQQLQQYEAQLLLYVAQERWREAYRPAQALRTAAIACGNRVDYCDALCTLAQITLHAEGPASALSFVEAALAVATEHGLLLELPAVHAVATAVYRQLGRPAEARQHVDALLDYVLARQGQLYALRHLLAGIWGLACLQRETLPAERFGEAVALVATQPQTGVATRVDALRLAATEGIDLTAAEAYARQPVEWGRFVQLVQALRAG
ncbi:MAG: AfsR/SARP family transcriptional regulator [Caldilineaceae bacterium]